MKSLLKWFAVLLLIPLLWLALVATHWLPRPRAGDLAAIELLRQASASVNGERNAFAALQSFAHDVPEDQWEAIAEADIAAFEQRQVNEDAGKDPASAAGRYPEYPKLPGDHPALCNVWVSDCVARVRANLEESRGFVEQSRARLERGEKLAQYDHYRYRFTPRFDSPLMPLSGYFQALLTQVALQHVDGDSQAAFATLCRSGATWRRLRAHNDALLLDMLATAILSGSARLYAEMLVEMPVEFAPPCPEVFAPLADSELDQCPVMRNEYLAFENTLAQMSDADLMAAYTGGSSVGGILGRRLFNSEHGLQVMARHIGAFCGSAHQARIAARSAAPLPPAPICTTLDWAFDPLGCDLAQIGLANYDEYYRRGLDLDGRLRLLNAAIALRGLDPAAAEQAFATRVPAQKSATHEMSIDSAAGVLRMRPLNTQRGEFWEMPYAQPASR